jgi:choline kinase
MIGLILAAGAGRRLRPYTDTLPKALVPLDGGRTVLHSTLENFAEVGLRDVAIVVGYCADAIERRVEAFERELGVSIELVHNDRAEEWNNAYSLWCAREHLARGAVLANGDTLHPASVERTLLEVDRPNVTLALDCLKSLHDEEMKVELDAAGRVAAISKSLPWDAAGEYIGVAVLPGGRASVLADALERTWTADSGRFYEDAFQLLADEGEAIDGAPIGAVDWVEIDDHTDLERAVGLCRS